MATDSDTSTQLVDIQRSIQLLIKLKLADIQGDKSQKEMVLFLGKLGCNASEIAGLLRLPRTSVSPILSKAKGGKGGK